MLQVKRNQLEYLDILNWLGFAFECSKHHNDYDPENRDQHVLVAHHTARMYANFERL